MSKSNPTESRRKILFAGGAGLFGIASVVAAWMAKARGKGGAQAEARRLASRIDLPKGVGSMMEAFARDPEKVKRFRELTEWRKMRDKELRNT
jgi:hypothetical protein